MKNIVYSVSHDQNARPEWILNSLNNHFNGTDENNYSFFEVIFKSETFVIARMDVDCYALVVNSLKIFFSSLNGVSDAIYKYEK